MVRANPAPLIIAVVLLVWANAIPGDFVYDDFPLIVDNPFIKSLKNLTALFCRDYLANPVNDFFYRGAYNLGSGESTYRPVATLTYFLDYRFYSAGPGLPFLLVFYSVCTR
jgi:hypothetical protein